MFVKGAGQRERRAQLAGQGSNLRDSLVLSPRRLQIEKQNVRRHDTSDLGSPELQLKQRNNSFIHLFIHWVNLLVDLFNQKYDQNSSHWVRI